MPDAQGDKQQLDYVIWFTDYPANHPRAGESVEVVTYPWYAQVVDARHDALREVARLRKVIEDLADAIEKEGYKGWAPEIRRTVFKP